MAVTIKINDKQFKQEFEKFQNKLSKTIEKGVLQAGFQLVTIIRELTKKGIDKNRNRFAPYSEGYLKHLQKKGYPTKVDLWYSGRMLGALTPDSKSVKKTGKHKVTVGFSNAEMRTRALFNQVLNEPKREFFGFNKRTENIIVKSFEKFLDKELQSFGI